ncbi:MAG: dTMP kinase [bacterium]|jgi:dTMP kinase
MPGRLIVFEGGEGAGKSTQLARLAVRLSAGAIRTATWREPGGTPLGDEIRRLLLDPAQQITPTAEALLFMASRAQLVRDELRPALDAGTTVLLDRFFLSTYAYQIAGRQMREQEVQAANALATQGLTPDLTILLTLNAEEGLLRAGARGGHDRMEGSGAEFHARVEAAFAEFATPVWQQGHPECGPIVAVSASGSVEDVAARVLGVVVAAFPDVAQALQVVV